MERYTFVRIFKLTSELYFVGIYECFANWSFQNCITQGCYTAEEIGQLLGGN